MTFIPSDIIRSGNARWAKTKF